LADKQLEQLIDDYRHRIAELRRQVDTWRQRATEAGWVPEGWDLATECDDYDRAREEEMADRRVHDLKADATGA
jgi:flagellar biosynthesis chaperone FliJ